MRLLSLDQCRAGDVVATTLRQADGRVVLRQGVVLTDTLLDQLRHWNQPVIPVEWPGFEDIDPGGWATDVLIQAFKAWAEQDLPLRAGGEAIRQAERLVTLVREGLAGRRTAFEFLPAYQGDSPFLVAWVNMVGLVVKLSEVLAFPRVDDYAVASVYWALSHPARRLGQVVALPADHHAALVEALRGLTVVSKTTLATLSQHHALYDGSGSPPLSGDAIYLGAAILGLAETVTYLTFRTDAPPVPAHEAVEWMLGGAGSEYPLAVVQVLQRTLAPYPVGSLVRIGGQEVAVVLRNSASWPTRPVVRVLNGAQARQTVDLAATGQESRVILGPYVARDLPPG